MNKTLKILLIALLALLALAFIGKKQGWFGGEEMVEVSVEAAKRRTIVETVAANGKIQPEVEVKISPDVSGEIIELAVKEGNEVKKGDLLVKINRDIYLANVDRLDAALNSAKANLANSNARLIEAEATFKRNKKLWEEELVSDADYEGIKANLEVAEQNAVASEFNIKSANASLKEARDNLAKTMIFAPVSGTVYMLTVEKGERVVGTSQMAGTELMRLANLNEMEVSVEVNENEIVRAKVGDTAEIEVDAYLDRKFKGLVTEVANSANTEGAGADQVTNFTVKIRILQESYKDLVNPEKPSVSPFRPGMSATVEIRTGIAENVIALPIQSVAIRMDSLSSATTGEKYQEEGSVPGTRGQEENSGPDKQEGKEECVFVLSSGKVKLQWVEIGIQDKDFIEIRKGIKEGDEVVSGPYSAISKKLNDGSKVEKVKKDDLYKKLKE